MVVLANSLLAPYPTWDLIVPKLHEQGFSVLRYDQPGHGKSSAPADIRQTTFTSLAEDAIHLLAHLGIEKVAAWIGVSMGSSTGMHVAAARPGLIERLVVCDCPTSHRDTIPLGKMSSAVQEAGTLTETADAILSRWLSPEWRERNPEEFERVRAITKSASLEGFRTCVNALTIESFDLEKIATRPGTCVDSVAMIVGERDGIFPQTMAQLAKTTEQGFTEAGRPGVSVDLTVIPDAGHICYIDGHSVFMDTILKILNN